MLQVDLWQLILAVASLIVAFATVVWVFGTTLVRQFKAQIDLRFNAIQAELAMRFAAIRDELQRRATSEIEINREFKRLEKEFLTFQRDMPAEHVRRDDYIRGQTIIESKIDAVMSKLELVQIQGAKLHAETGRYEKFNKDR